MVKCSSANHGLEFSTRKATSKGEPTSTPSDEYSGTGRSDQTAKAEPASAATVAAARTTQRKDCAPMVAISSSPCRSGSSMTCDCLRERERRGVGRLVVPRLADLRFGGME